MRRDGTRAARGAAAYYNEIDPYAAEWLRNLIAAGHIAAGDVDERSIVDVHPDDLRGYRQCHFFAGIGGWSLALRLAGWPDDRPVWTGSCPCQSFSLAGKGRGFDDERHLWPAWFRLIRECRPPVVFGEQVAAAVKHGWLDLVFDDLERVDYACWAAIVPAGAVGAFHRRERVWFMARTACVVLGDSGEQRCEGEHPLPQRAGAEDMPQAARPGEACWLADAEGLRRKQGGSDARRCDEGIGAQGGGCGSADIGGQRMDDSKRARLEGHGADQAEGGRHGEAGSATEAGALDAWRDIEWLACSDGKARPTQPGLCPLAHGVPARVGRLRAYGNAIVPQVAAQLIRTVTS